jgi:hypothetical protein
MLRYLFVIFRESLFKYAKGTKLIKRKRLYKWLLQGINRLKSIKKIRNMLQIVYRYQNASLFYSTDNSSFYPTATNHIAMFYVL